MKINKLLDSMGFRVINKYKKTILIGFFLGLSLVFGVVIASQAGENQPRQAAQAPKSAEGSGDSEGIERQSTGQDAVESSKSNLTAQEDSEPSGSTRRLMGKRFTVLLVGVDRRKGEVSVGNTDSLLVASVNPADGKIALLSIPRDTQINIPGSGENKINAAGRLGGGLEMTANLISDLIGQPIDGYALTNFAGFKAIIDTLGGITLNVEKNMYYVTGDAMDGIINLKKGTQRLNGTQALQYARFRNDAFADISRTSRQQAVLKAVGRELLQVKTIPKLPRLIPQMLKSVETNLSLNTIWSMTNVLLGKKPEIISQTLPGAFVTENGISYWKVDVEKSRSVARKLFEEGKTSSVFFK